MKKHLISSNISMKISLKISTIELTQSLKSTSSSLWLLLLPFYLIRDCWSSDLLGAEIESYPFNYKIVESTTLI
jgi:hypothetical protein